MVENSSGWYLRLLLQEGCGCGQEFVGPGQQVGELGSAHARSDSVVAQVTDILRVDEIAMEATSAFIPGSLRGAR